MVRLDDRLNQIKRLYVDRGKYFVINRGRQYGKTTTLRLLTEYLRDDYAVIPMDFQLMSTANFADEQTFVVKFVSYLEKLLSGSEARAEDMDAGAVENLVSLQKAQNPSLDVLFREMSRLCRTAKKPVVLIIDEVDSAANNQVFLDFLAQLRGYYIDREQSPAFHSVILAGVYDIKNLKLKIRPEAEHQYNSPWNIAAEFNVKMDFSATQIEGMLQEYEADCHTGMDTAAMAEQIYQYTSGYPYLVSAICKILDEQLPEEESFTGNGDANRKIWSGEGIGEAVKILLKRKLPLFDSMVRQLDQYPELRDMMEQIMYEGKELAFSPDIKPINLGIMFGFLREKDGRVVIANRVFEMRLLNLFITEEALKSDSFQCSEYDKPRFIQSGRLDMKRVLEKFVEHFHEIYGENDERFIEKYGRKFFLLYLKPIINGTGNYYLEAQTRDAGRTDVVVDYRGEQFIVEMKIWRGNEYNERGEEQLVGYLDYFHQKKGYMLSFNFNKKKEIGVKTIAIGEKEIVEAVV
nr:ATP-binding protein [uncultured Acetatifactor sp.]